MVLFKTPCEPHGPLLVSIVEFLRDCTSVVEFGVGRAPYLKYLPVRKRLGIDCFEPYIDWCNEVLKDSGCRFVHGNVMNYRAVLDQPYDAALVVDMLEHLSKDDAVVLLEQIKQDFRKAYLFVPLGEHPQDAIDGNEAQRHLSVWFPPDFTTLGFGVSIDPAFDPGKEGSRGAMHVLWVRST